MIPIFLRSWNVSQLFGLLGKKWICDQRDKSDKKILLFTEERYQRACVDSPLHSQFLWRTVQSAEDWVVIGAWLRNKRPRDVQMCFRCIHRRKVLPGHALAFEDRESANNNNYKHCKNKSARYKELFRFRYPINTSTIFDQKLSSLWKLLQGLAPLIQNTSIHVNVMSQFVF